MTDPVTRSVEIPDEGVRRALDGYRSVPTYGTYRGQCDAMRVALAAALPYLAPAEPEGGLCPSVWYPAHGARQWCTREKDHAGVHVDRDGQWGAPAGDGGLREALEKIKAKLDERSEEGEAHLFLNIPYWQLEDLLAAHPAVPQPAEVEYDDEELESEADVERRNHWFRLAVELGQQDEFIEMLAHERRMPATRAEQTAALDLLGGSGDS